MAAERVDRPTPWSVLFATIEPRYPDLGTADLDLAAFSKAPAAQQLLEAIQSPELLEREPVAAAGYLHLLYADWMHWRHRRATRGPGPAYLAFAPRAYWMQPDPEGPHEPLDGCYVIPVARDELLIVAVLGLHAGRAGVSEISLTVPATDVAAAAAALPEDAYAPAMPGGDAAGFKSVRTAAELLHLIEVARGGTGS